MEYTAQKAAGVLQQTHLKPLSEIFTSEQLDKIPVDNKVGENCFGEMAVQLRKKGGASFKAIGERLVLSSNADLAFSVGAEKMLADKELTKRRTKLTRLKLSGQRPKRTL